MDQCPAYQNHTIDCFEAYFDEFTATVGCASHSSSPAAAPVVVSVEPHPPGAEQLRCDNSCPCRTPECHIGCPLAEHDEQIRQEAAAKERAAVLDAGLLYRLVYWAVLFRDKNNRLPTGEESVKWVLESHRGERPPQEPHD